MYCSNSTVILQKVNKIVSVLAGFGATYYSASRLTVGQQVHGSSAKKQTLFECSKFNIHSVTSLFYLFSLASSPHNFFFGFRKLVLFFYKHVVWKTCAQPWRKIKMLIIFLAKATTHPSIFSWSNLFPPPYPCCRATLGPWTIRPDWASQEIGTRLWFYAQTCSCLFHLLAVASQCRRTPQTVWQTRWHPCRHLIIKIDVLAGEIRMF